MLVSFAFSDALNPPHFELIGLPRCVVGRPPYITLQLESYGVNPTFDPYNRFYIFHFAKQNNFPKTRILFFHPSFIRAPGQHGLAQFRWQKYSLDCNRLCDHRWHCSRPKAVLEKIHQSYLWSRRLVVSG